MCTNCPTVPGCCLNNGCRYPGAVPCTHRCTVLRAIRCSNVEDKNGAIQCSCAASFRLVVWANCTKKLQMRLERLKNYGMRVILQVPARTPSSISRAKLRWVTLEQCRALQRLRAVHRCVHGTAPGYLQSLFKQQLVHVANSSSP